MLESLQRNESFSYSKLTPEEMEARGILGRLVGPCADFTIPTRNGRKYEETLWEKVFNDDIVNEKIANKCLFGELGHPADREEVEPEKIAIALNEAPKKNADGQLIACFDILNTPCGKILKALCDYGTTIGISSRGSGDLMTDANGDEVVDPDTYSFECFDAVLLPAVKSARLQYMTESVDTKALKLKKALRESYEAASDEDKKIMKETFNELDLNVDDEEEVKIDAIPDSEDPQDLGDNLVEAKKADEEEATAEDEEADKVEDTEESEASKEDEPKMEVSDIAKLAKDAPEEDLADDEKVEEEKEICTVGELVKELKDFDKKAEIEFKPIVINDIEYPVDMLSFDDSEDGKILIEIGYTAEERDNKDEENIEDAEEAIPEEEPEIAVDELIDDEAEDDSEEAIDDGVEEVVESLKEVVRQKGLLEQEIKSLKDTKTVSDAEVKNLKEELNKYKVAFARTSEIAGKAKSAVAEVKKLTEQLNSKEQEIASLKEKNSISLNESVNNAKAKIKSLSSQLNESADKLADQEKTYRAKLNESVQIAKQYKTKYTEAVNKYVAFRASMLGVRPADIINKLNENYSFENIDTVCDNILTESAPINSFGFRSASKVKINEQISKRSTEDDDLKDLYELAGLDY